MWNTCLIGRRWKPREGWSRPVLTGDGDIAAHSPSCVWGWVRVFAAAGLLATRSVVPVVTKRCSRPLSGSRTVTARAGGGAWVVFLLAGRGSRFLGVRAVGGGFCGGHGPGVTPGPFPNPEAKAWHGDGTAPGRVWESNTPPQTFLVGFPVEPTLRETPPFLYPVPDGIPLDGPAAPGGFFFAFSCLRSSGSSAAFITTCLWSNKRVRRHHQI